MEDIMREEIETLFRMLAARTRVIEALEARVKALEADLRARERVEVNMLRPMLRVLPIFEEEASA
jgi:hypothetical protein